MNRLITFEGVDGCGKSTQLKLAAQWLRGRGEQVVTAFEPGDTSLGKEIRTLLLAGEFVPVAEAELLMFLADRAQHVREKIQPALDSGAWVLCDRYTDSTLAYQLAARKLAEGAANLKDMLRFAECGVSPQLTLWFDVSVTVAMQRMKKRAEAGEKATRLDDEAASFHQRVAEAFGHQFEFNSGRITRIDAEKDINGVFAQVEQALEAHFSLS
ncbi:dTMP kinase [Mariprofundus micogutta]|uniref:Thymidylate kinase n=1 Tax=Mariprofundus micogutta TaxID=1921010 RepID=A0A1L8CNA9_9PROT|nr:dTMP kinase [Mariprofundus micogutta]GAV20401.1 dTMP kinase [Mariprofundus micogutta]